MSGQGPEATRLSLAKPDVSRMEELERAVAAEMAQSAELWVAAEAARGPWLKADEALDRYDLETNPDPARWRLLKAELDRTWANVKAAQDAWRVATMPEHAHRVEWLQLQVIRGFLPRCALCERTVGPVHLTLGRDERPPALCLDCFDTWFCGYQPDNLLPPSHWLELTAQESRGRESGRRSQMQVDQLPLRVLGVDETVADPLPARPCWQCGGPVDDVDVDWGCHYVARGAHLPPLVVLKVAALVSEGTQPEIGEVCLLCLDHDLELFDRWAAIEHDLTDPVRRRHEAAQWRWVNAAPDAPPTESPRSATC